MKSMLQKYKKFLPIILMITILQFLFADFIQPFSVEAALDQYNAHRLVLGTINNDKVVEGNFTSVNIEGPHFPNITGLAPTEADIRVDNKHAGKTILFSDTNIQYNRGWYHVDTSEARNWVTLFNGNPNYVLSSAKSNVYTNSITDNNGAVNYDAYALAELANASGGWGEITGDNIEKVNGKYKSVGKFFTTPRPTGDVTIPKTNYKVGETVNITAATTDYSKYDKGFKILTFEVVNQTTSGGWKNYLKNKEIKASNIESEKDSYTWTKGENYIPTEPGTYKVTLTFTDWHDRTTQDSPNISVAKPIERYFTVESPDCNLRIYEGSRASGTPLPSGKKLSSDSSSDSWEFTSNEMGTWYLKDHKTGNERTLATGNNVNTGDLSRGTYILTFEANNPKCPPWTQILVVGEAALECDPNSPVNMDVVTKQGANSLQTGVTGERTHSAPLYIEYSGSTPYSQVWIATDYRVLTGGSPSSDEGSGQWEIDGKEVPKNLLNYTENALNLGPLLDPDGFGSFQIVYKSDKTGKTWCRTVIVKKSDGSGGEDYCPTNGPVPASTPIQLISQDGNIPNESVINVPSVNSLSSYKNLKIKAWKAVKTGTEYESKSDGSRYQIPKIEWFYETVNWGDAKGLNENTWKARSKTTAKLIYNGDVVIRSFEPSYHKGRDEDSYWTDGPSSINLQDSIKSYGLPGKYTLEIVNTREYSACDRDDPYKEQYFKKSILMHKIDIIIGGNMPPIAKYSAVEKNGVVLDHVEQQGFNRTVYYTVAIPAKNLDKRELKDPVTVQLVNESYDQPDSSGAVSDPLIMTYDFSFDFDDYASGDMYPSKNPSNGTNPGVDSRKIVINKLGTYEACVKVLSDKGNPALASTNLAKVVIKVEPFVKTSYNLNARYEFGVSHGLNAKDTEVYWEQGKLLEVEPIAMWKNLSYDKNVKKYYIPEVSSFSLFVAKKDERSGNYVNVKNKTGIVEEDSGNEWVLNKLAGYDRDGERTFGYADESEWEIYGAATRKKGDPSVPSYRFYQDGTYKLTWSVLDVNGQSAVSNDLYVHIGQRVPACDLKINATVNGKKVDVGNTLHLETDEDYALGFTASSGGEEISDVTWRLKKDGREIESKVTDRFKYDFYEEKEASYALEARYKKSGIICSATITINFKPFSCDVTSVEVTSKGKEVWGSMSSGTSEWEPKKYNISLGDTLNFKALSSGSESGLVADFEIREGSFSGTPIKSSPSTNNFSFKFEAAKTYYVVVTIYVNGIRCNKYLEIQTVGKDCSGIYLHVGYQVGDKSEWLLNQAGKTVVIPKDKVDMIGVALLSEPDKVIGVGLFSANWKGTKPNEAGDSNELGYRITNVGPGTYVITGTVEDNNYHPEKNGCTFTVTIVVGDKPVEPCTTCEPGGIVDGGQLLLRIYDSDNRLLRTVEDGVWEKETARIEVEIEQNKINQAFSKIDDNIRNAINKKKQELKSIYESKGYEDVSVEASPASWQSKGNSRTIWPPTTSLTVDGPGIDNRYTLDTKRQVQSNYYTGTTVPTKDGNKTLNPNKYNVKVDGFAIQVPYEINFDISYMVCQIGEGEDAGIDCTPGHDTDKISNTFTIQIKGTQTRFEVFDLWVKGLVRHTEEWNKNRQSYNRIVSGDPEKPRGYDVYWAGEKFVLHASVPDTGTSSIKATNVLVTMSHTNLKTNLQPVDKQKSKWLGDLWRSNFPKLPDGFYKFTFDATWIHGHKERDEYMVEIRGVYTEFFELHRLH
ncbi:hypothetical protein NW801_22210 [Brevibacillus laterosporus]|uniref:Ig-like domain-containing protein n=1 Tax=Brevibacillus halotolerans TaxID=1507437 RepID=A0ABT4I4H2_9BACL|nr:MULTISPECIES: hypothetical protein [Brevibacillus]MCR8987708.1 hypothetical protein [Brevibacillus laterosporus]MCZ0833447.1 hypothetical protein [Brevibacillus halotolerans]